MFLDRKKNEFSQWKIEQFSDTFGELTFYYTLGALSAGWPTFNLELDLPLLEYYFLEQCKHSWTLTALKQIKPVIFDELYITGIYAAKINFLWLYLTNKTDYLHFSCSFISMKHYQTVFCNLRPVKLFKLRFITHIYFPVFLTWVCWRFQDLTFPV